MRNLFILAGVLGLLMIGLALVAFAPTARAQTTANLPVTCSTSGQCVRATPIVNPDGTPVGGGGGGSVTVTNFPATQPVSGPVTNAQLTAVTGTATAAAWNGSDASATLLAILRAIYAQLNLANTSLGEIEQNTRPTVP